MRTERPSWDAYFLGIAFAVAERSDCRRSKVGAVLVDRSHRILATGYVGVAPGRRGCLDGACPRGLKTLEEVPAYSPYTDCISTHAEINCLNYTEDMFGIDFYFWDTTLYITRAPCNNCFHYALDRGVGDFIYP